MASTTEQKKHVPAWKRLGLKLKNTDDSAATVTPPKEQSTRPNSARDDFSRNAWNGSSQAVNGHEQVKGSSSDHKSTSKKRKRQDPPASSTAHSVSDGGKGDSDREGQAATKTPKRKKSVTFSESTKTEDGDTAASVPLTPKSQRKPISPATDPIPKTPKEDKKAKPKKSAESKSRETLACLVYLQEFHNSRATWKFNKAKQIELLKNLWNPFRIPPEHDEALLSYVQGLQGAAARTRLASQAREVLSKDASTLGLSGMPTLSDREAAREAAAQRWRDQHSDLNETQLRERVEKDKREQALAKRAEMILSDALDVALGIETAEQQKKRKRKARTVDVESDDSSSSSDSDSDSSSSSSDSDSDSDSSSSASSDSDSDSVSSSASSSTSDSDSDSSSDSDSDSQKARAKKRTKRKAKKDKDVPFDSALLDRIRPPPITADIRARAAEKRAAAEAEQKRRRGS